MNKTVSSHQLDSCALFRNCIFFVNLCLAALLSDKPLQRENNSDVKIPHQRMLYYLSDNALSRSYPQKTKQIMKD